jgi:hypothetical protein
MSSSEGKVLLFEDPLQPTGYVLREMQEIKGSDRLQNVVELLNNVYC